MSKPTTQNVKETLSTSTLGDATEYTIYLYNYNLYNEYLTKNTYDKLPWYYKIYHLGCTALHIPNYYSSNTTWHKSSSKINIKFIPYKIIYTKYWIYFINKYCQPFMQLQKGYLLDRKLNTDRTNVDDWILCTQLDTNFDLLNISYLYIPTPIPSLSTSSLLYMPNELLRIMSKNGNWNWSTYHKLAMAHPSQFRDIMIRLVTLAPKNNDTIAVLDSYPLYNSIDVKDCEQNKIYNTLYPSYTGDHNSNYILFENGSIHYDMYLGIIVAIANVSNHNRLRNNVVIWDIATGRCLSQIKPQQYLPQYMLTNSTYIYNPFVNSIKNKRNLQYSCHMKIRRFIKTYCKGINKTYCWLITINKYFIISNDPTYPHDYPNYYLNVFETLQKYTINLYNIPIDMDLRTVSLDMSDCNWLQFDINKLQFEYLQKLMLNVHPHTNIPNLKQYSYDKSYNYNVLNNKYSIPYPFIINFCDSNHEKNKNSPHNNNIHQEYIEWFRNGYMLPIYGI